MSLPPLYERWMAGALPGAIPEEGRATCSDCVMVSHPERVPTVTFASDTKCCTYQPDLHNFLVGAILGDPDRGLQWANEILALRIERRTGVTPLGIRPDALKWLIYDRVVDPSPEAFGRLRELRCPFYIVHGGGTCGIWRHRNAICTTWFCQFERGMIGRSFWKLVLGLLRYAEQAVSTWVVLELDPGPEAHAFLAQLAQRRDIAVQDAIEPPPAPAYRAVWGRWFGRETEFYTEASRLASGLSWSDVRRIAGPDLASLELVARRAYDRLVSTELPAEVVRSPEALYQIHPRKPDHVRMMARSVPFDPLDLPATVIDQLPRLGERKPRDAFDDTTLRQLLDYGVVAPASPRDEP